MSAPPVPRSPVHELLDQLYAARQTPSPETRDELRDEVRVAACLLIAAELENIATAMHSAIEGINSAIDVITNTERT